MESVKKQAPTSSDLLEAWFRKYSGVASDKKKMKEIVEAVMSESLDLIEESDLFVALAGTVKDKNAKTELVNIYLKFKQR